MTYAIIGRGRPAAAQSMQRTAEAPRPPVAVSGLEIGDEVASIVDNCKTVLGSRGANVVGCCGCISSSSSWLQRRAVHCILLNVALIRAAIGLVAGGVNQRPKQVLFYPALAFECAASLERADSSIAAENALPAPWSKTLHATMATIGSSTLSRPGRSARPRPPRCSIGRARRYLAVVGRRRTDGDDHLNTEFRTAMHRYALQGHPGAQGMLRGERPRSTGRSTRPTSCGTTGSGCSRRMGVRTLISSRQSRSLTVRVSRRSTGTGLAAAGATRMACSAGQFRCAMHRPLWRCRASRCRANCRLSSLARRAPGAAAAGRLGTITDAERASLGRCGQHGAGRRGRRQVAHAVLSRSQLPNDDLAHLGARGHRCRRDVDLHEFGIAMHPCCGAPWRRPARRAARALLKPNQPPQTGSGAAEGRQPVTHGCGRRRSLAGHSVRLGPTQRRRGGERLRAMKPSDRKVLEVFMNVLGAARRTVGVPSTSFLACRAAQRRAGRHRGWRTSTATVASLDEFCVAMHLVSRRVAGDELPTGCRRRSAPRRPGGSRRRARFTFGAAFETIVGPSARG